MFGGQPFLQQRNESFEIKESMAVHCRFVRGKKPGYGSGFDIDEADLLDMEQCHGVVVASAIFGNYDVIQQPKNISEATKARACFYMFVDEETKVYIKNSSTLDSTRRVGLWRVIIVRNLPYVDSRRNGKVYLHQIIRDTHGRKMSKSLGNVIDPLEMINGISLEGLHKRLEEGNIDPNELTLAREGQAKDFRNGIPECGADALRFALIMYTAQSSEINLKVSRVVTYQQWCNKLWNAMRSSMTKLGDNYVPPPVLVVDSMPPICKWILFDLNKTVSKTVSSLESYKFSDAADAVYYWWQYRLCDVFIEAIKPYFSLDSQYEYVRATSRDVLWVCLDTGLRLLHPFMPFVTEELWQRLPKRKGISDNKESIMISEYPSVIEAWTNEQIENDLEIVLSVIKKLRSLRPPSDKIRRPGFALCRDQDVTDVINAYEFEIVTLASVLSLEVLRVDDTPSDYCEADVVNKKEKVTVYLQLQ